MCDAQNAEDLIRRLQSTIFSLLAMINAWYIHNSPWKQVDREQNNRGSLNSEIATMILTLEENANTGTLHRPAVIGPNRYTVVNWQRISA